MDRFGIIIQARLGSKRYPRKITEKIGSLSMVEFCVTRALEVPNTHVVVCAPDDESNQPFWTNFNTCSVVYGSHNNVLQRYLKAALSQEFDVIVRLTADNPYFSKRTIEEAIVFLQKNNLDYVSAKRDDGAWLPFGVGCEVFSLEALKLVSGSHDLTHQEHVSEAFLEHSETRCGILFKPLEFCSPRTKDFSLTFDYPEQMALLRELELAK
jgi:spore coat polysaccharide biosynthesis protein SpsF (cytidylyltransferase family)